MNKKCKGYFNISYLILFLTTQAFKDKRNYILVAFSIFFIIGAPNISAQNKNPQYIFSGNSRFTEPKKTLTSKSEIDFQKIDTDNNLKNEKKDVTDVFQVKRYSLRRKFTNFTKTEQTDSLTANRRNIFDFEIDKYSDLKSDRYLETKKFKCPEIKSHFKSCANKSVIKTNPYDEILTDDPPKVTDTDQTDEGFQWRSAIKQSLLFLSIQHGYALTQPKTRQALKEGNFFKDYVKSVKSLNGWGDGGRFFTNYIAHPMQGAFTGFIQVHNDPKGKKLRFGNSADYWKSRLKAMAWSAAWSTQFEIGPLSQASIGNVGLSGKQTYVDIVMTPTAGTAMLITEDALDRYLIERIESKTKNYYVIIFSRMLLNPTRTMANLIRFKLPWYRDRARIYGH